MDEDRVRVLEALGVDEVDETVYQALIDQWALTMDEVGISLSLPEAIVRKSLRALEAMGLVVRTADKPSRFTAVPPGVAVSALISRRQARLDEVRVAVRLLEERYRKSDRRTSISDVIEVVVGEEAITHRFFQMQLSAREEVLFFDRPPYIVTSAANTAEFEMLQRGLRYRVIYDSEALDWPGMLDGVLRCVEAGEEARTHSRVPMKLIIGDKALALVTLAREPAERVEGALIVHPSNLLDGLCSLWDAYWEQAIPLKVGVHSSQAASRSSERDEQLMSLLAAGLKTSVIARQLGIGQSTVERRTKQLMERLGARTRIQLGIQLAIRGMIPESGAPSTHA